MKGRSRAIIQHVLHGIGGGYGGGSAGLTAMVIPEGTVLLKLQMGNWGTVKATPHVTKKDLQLTIRRNFVEEISWDDLEEEEPEEEI